MNKEEFINECLLLNIDIENKYDKLYKYYEMLVLWNSKFNMTSITEEKDVFLLHFYDSLCLIKAIETSNKSLCDFGCGAGFPGMVIAIVFGDINVTLVESNQKKCMFLNEVKNQLNLKNVIVINDRIENYSKKEIEKFDYITCRAVTSIPIIIETSINSLKVNGYLIPMKSNCDDEIKLFKSMEDEFGVNLIDIIKYNLPINNALRQIPIYKKIKKTNTKYPRNYSVLSKLYKNKKSL